MKIFNVMTMLVDIRLTPALILLVLVLTAGMFAGCTSPSASADSQIPATRSISSNASLVERVEVFHFHRTQQCPSCIAIGNLTEMTVKAKFKKELASGKLVFAHIGYELPENAALAEKYGVTGSSLWIGVYNSTGFHKEEDIKVWYLINDENAFFAHITDLVTRRLSGDLS